MQLQVVSVAIAALIAFFVMGNSVKFSYGLVLGTAIVIINLTLLAFTTDMALIKKQTGMSSLATAGYLVRIILFGGAFYVALKTGYPSAIGMIIAYIISRFAFLITIFFKWKKNSIEQIGS